MPAAFQRDASNIVTVSPTNPLPVAVVESAVDSGDTHRRVTYHFDKPEADATTRLTQMVEQILSGPNGTVLTTETTDYVYHYPTVQ